VPAVTSQQASAYLKGLATEDGKDSSRTFLGEKDDDRVFADPYYWAPFVLVGDHRLGASSRE
jgi:CHAT domain-containing protein